MAASLVERVDRDLGFRSDLVVEAERTDHIVVTDHVEDRSGAAPPPLDDRLERLGRGRVEVVDQGGATHGDLVPVDDSLHASSGERHHVGGRWDVVVSGGGDDGLGDGVFAVGLDRGRKGQDAVGVPSIGRRVVDDRVVASGQGAGLVEQYGVDGSHAFEGQTILHQDPGLGLRWRWRWR